MLQPHDLPPLPTFESFILRRVNEIASLGAKEIAALLDDLLDGMNAARLNATERYPDNLEQAEECVFDWACGVLQSKLERALDESEQAYLREESKCNR